MQRIEEIGYDKDERQYIVLDDNRLYRRTEPPPPPAPKAKPKSNSKKGKAAARASKRRKTLDPDESANDVDADTPAVEDGGTESKEEDDGLGGRKWECIAITLGQYQGFLASIQKSRDQDEIYLHKRITHDILPVIEKAEESQQRKKQKQERELMNIQKLATAKRSSRLEAKMDREREEREAAELEQKKKADLIAAKQDQEKQKKMEEARESRMMTREQRIKDREYKRLLHEEELANLSEENKKVEAGEAKKSERHLKTEMEKKKAELAALQDDGDWIFDCAKCGKHGTNLVSFTDHVLRASPLKLTFIRTMGHTVSHAISATSGNTVPAWVSLRQKPRRTIFSSSVAFASVEKKMQRSPKSQASNSTSGLRLLHPARKRRSSFLGSMNHRNANRSKSLPTSHQRKSSNLWTSIAVHKTPIRLDQLRVGRMDSIPNMARTGCMQR